MLIPSSNRMQHNVDQNEAGSSENMVTLTNMPIIHGPDLSHIEPRFPDSSYTPNIVPSNSNDKIQYPSSDCLVYMVDKHASNCFETMNNLRKSHELCDIVLLIDEREIYAHRVVLAACSPYFRAMFTAELAESRQSEIKLHDLDADALENLINFCYTSEIVVEQSNVQNLLPAACLLQLFEIQDVCCEFLKRQLDVTNCLGIRAFADTHACHDLMLASDQFIVLHFPEVINSEEFPLLSVKHLGEILNSDELNVHNEEEVYVALMRWINYDLSERKSSLSYLLQFIRLPLINPKFLVNTISTDPLIVSDQYCRDLVDEAKNYLILPQERSRMQGPRTRPRKVLKPGQIMFAIGGWCSGSAIASAEYYDPCLNKWTLVTPMHKRRCGVGIGVLNNLIYAVGGHDGQSYLNSVERYDPYTNQWLYDIAPTNTCRTSVGVVVLNDFMYAVGGQDGTSCLNLVEFYDPNVNRWFKAPSLTTRRLGLGVTVLDGQLYAIGGTDGQTSLATVEHYDPRVGYWQRMCSMSTKRKHIGVTVYNDLIFAVGGRDESVEFSSVEYLDVRCSQWLPFIAMTSRRSGVSLGVINNEMIAIGGFDGLCYLKTFESFNTLQNSWSIKGNLNVRRLGGGVGVIHLDTPINNQVNFYPDQRFNSTSSTTITTSTLPTNHIPALNMGNSVYNNVLFDRNSSSTQSIPSQPLHRNQLSYLSNDPIRTRKSTTCSLTLTSPSSSKSNCASNSNPTFPIHSNNNNNNTLCSIELSNVSKPNSNKSEIVCEYPDSFIGSNCTLTTTTSTNSIDMNTSPITACPVDNNGDRSSSSRSSSSSSSNTSCGSTARISSSNREGGNSSNVGFNDTDNLNSFYASDCIRPNQIGSEIVNELNATNISVSQLKSTSGEVNYDQAEPNNSNSALMKSVNSTNMFLF